MPCKLSSKVSFTAVPNLYTDNIKPHLTNTQKDICDIVIRMTIGWQKSSAKISNSTFVKMSGKPEKAIITAKKQLIDMGLLIMLEPPRSNTPALYTIDLYYDDPNKSIKHKEGNTTEDTPKDSPAIPATKYKDNTNTPDLLTQDDDTNFEILVDNPQHDDEIINVTELIPEDDNFTDEPIEDIVGTTEDITGTTEIIPSDDDTTGEPIEDTTGTTELVPPDDDTTGEPIEDIPASTQKAADNPYDNSSKTASNEMKKVQPSTEVSSAPYSIISNSLNIINKHTEEQNGEEKRKNPKKAVASVRFYFLSTFPETKAEDDWKFFGWMIKEYGLEACMYQLNYMKEYRKKHPITNPKGFFKCSLEKNYQIPAFITAKIKADERANLAIEHGKSIKAQMAQWQKEAVDFNTGQAAISNMISMLGQKEREDEIN